MPTFATLESGDFNLVVERPGMGALNITPVHDSIRFSTAAVGGFGAASFKLQGYYDETKVPLLSIVRINYSGVILWEGRIEDVRWDVEEEDWTSSFECFGFQRLLSETSMRRVWISRNPDFYQIQFADNGAFQPSTGFFNPGNLSQYGILWRSIDGLAYGTGGFQTVGISVQHPNIIWKRYIAQFEMANATDFQFTTDPGQVISSPQLFDSLSVRNDLKDRDVQIVYGAITVHTGDGGDYGSIYNMKFFGSETPPADNAEGFFGHTLIKDIVASVPGLTAGMIESDFNFTVEDFDKFERTFCRALIDEVTSYYTKEWAVWENGELSWKSYNLDIAHWIIPLMDCQSIHLETSVQGIHKTTYVLFSDAKKAGLPNEANFVGTSKRNPYARLGVPKDNLISTPFRSTDLAALRLAEKLVKIDEARPTINGSITLPVYQNIKTNTGEHIPAFMIRAGTNILIPDAPTDDPFLYGEDGRTLFHISYTDVDFENGTVNIELQGQMNTADVLLARLAAVTRIVTGGN